MRSEYFPFGCYNQHVNGQPRQRFGDVLVVSLIPALAFVGSSMLAPPIGTRLGLTGTGSILLRGMAPGLLGIGAAVLVEQRLDGGPFHEVIRRLGMSRPNLAQIGVGAVAAIPIGMAYGVLFSCLGLSSNLVEHWPFQVIKFVVAQGITEEVIFRGFVFRRLRRGRPFGRAASLSAVIFSLGHLGNLVAGITVAVLIAVSVSLVFAVLLTYPAAYLFERGGDSIWGFGVLHVAIDSINWFQEGAPPGGGLVVYLAAVVGTIPIVFWRGRRLTAR